MLNILSEIYTDKKLRVGLGFKGGTAAMLFYNLPRFSVDLDFDLLDTKYDHKDLVSINNIVEKYGKLVEVADKKHTLLYLINYESGLHNLKIEISKRPVATEYELKNYLGIQMQVMSRADMTASKIAALLTRSNFASRDLFDVWFFLKNSWPINNARLEKIYGSPAKVAFENAVKKIGGMQDSNLLVGLGELINKSQKYWVKQHLVKETIFQLKLYQSNI